MSQNNHMRGYMGMLDRAAGFGKDVYALFLDSIIMLFVIMLAY